LEGLSKEPAKASNGPANKGYHPHLNFIWFSKNAVIPLNGIKLKLVCTFKIAASNNKPTNASDVSDINLTSLTRFKITAIIPTTAISKITMP
jgi:hypothetical protein